MATLNRPDYSFKGEVPTSSIIQAYQQKAMAEQKAEQEKQMAKEQKWVDIAKMVQSGAQLVTQMTEQSAKKAQQEAQVAMQGLLGRAAEPRGETQYGQTPEYKAELASLVAKGYPEEFGKQGVKTAMDQLYPDSGAPSDRFQQSTVQRPDPTTGQMKTYFVTFDKSTGQQLNPRTQKPLVTEADYEGLDERGFAQTLRPGGYTVEGKEVVVDSRNGNKYVMAYDEQGNQTQTKYDGVIYPKLDNIPAGMADALGELGYSQQVLERISTKFKPAYAGPVAARAGKMSAYVGALTKEQQVEFYADVAEYKNSIIRAITGAQLNKDEVPRIMQQIPNENASPQAFAAGLRRAYVATQQRIAAKEKALANSGYKQRGSFATESDVQEQIEKKLDNLFPKGWRPEESAGGAPAVGGLYDGKKITKVKRIR